MSEDLMFQTYSSLNGKQAFGVSHFQGWNTSEHDQHKNQLNQLNQIYEYLQVQAIENPSKSVDTNNEKSKISPQKILKSPKNKTSLNHKESFSVHQRSSTIVEHSYEYPVAFPKISVTKATIKHKKKNNKSPEPKKTDTSTTLKNNKRLKTDRGDQTMDFQCNTDALTKESISKQNYYNFMRETPVFDDVQQIQVLSISEPQKKFSFQHPQQIGNLRYEDYFTRRDYLRQKQNESLQKNHRQMKIPIVSFLNNLDIDQNNNQQVQQAKSRFKVEPPKYEKVWQNLDQQEIQKAKEQIKVSINKIIPLSQVLGLNYQPTLNSQIKRLVQLPIIVQKPIYPRPMEAKPHQVQELKLK